LLCSLLAGCVFNAPAAPGDSGLRLQKDAQLPDAIADAGVEPDATQIADAEALDAEVQPDAFEDAGVDAEVVDAEVVDTGVEIDIPHLAPEDRSPGTDDLILDSQTIDTSALTIATPLPSGVTFTSVAQWPSGPELAVLRVGSLEVATDAVVRVIGSRPFVVIAAGEVRLRGRIDIAGRNTTPGAGGHPTQMGPGAGSDAEQSGSWSDPGGGGAGHATIAREGGASEAGTLAGGAPGGPYGDSTIAVLEGGSGGGRGGPGGCTRTSGGGGGGAIQIYSATRIRIDVDGAIDAGGGGGLGGNGCSASGNAGAGSGGGSGGVILLQAPQIEQLGMLGANGGGGGGGGSSGTAGNPGEDAHLDGTPAAGGATLGTYGYAGGNGGFETTDPVPGTAAPGTGASGGNSGSGGGSIGFIRILTQQAFTNEGSISPAPATAIY
jgi:hypothetical protein